MTTSGSDLQIFMADYPPDKKQSKLMPFLADIQTLESSGYSYKSIARYLKEVKGIQISEVSVGRFINKEIRAGKISTQKNGKQSTVGNKTLPVYRAPDLTPPKKNPLEFTEEEREEMRKNQAAMAAVLQSIHNPNYKPPKPFRWDPAGDRKKREEEEQQKQEKEQENENNGKNILQK